MGLTLSWVSSPQLRVVAADSAAFCVCEWVSGQTVSGQALEQRVLKACEHLSDVCCLFEWLVTVVRGEVLHVVNCRVAHR